ncbi:unnamed protein product, partial [Closterium sp. NIES-64]
MGHTDAPRCACGHGEPVPGRVAKSLWSCPTWQGFLYEEPSGYFGTATEEAVIKWQTSNALVPARGIVGYSSRVAYARKHGLPTTEQLRAMEKAAEVRRPAMRCCTILILTAAPSPPRPYACGNPCPLHPLVSDSMTPRPLPVALRVEQGCEVRRCIEIDAHKRNGMELWERCLACVPHSPPLPLLSRPPSHPLPASPLLSLCPSPLLRVSICAPPLAPHACSTACLRACTCGCTLRTPFLAPPAAVLSASGGQEGGGDRVLLEDASLADRMHLCSEACQMAVSEACDKNEAAEEAAQKAEKEAEAAEAGAVDEWRWTLNWNHILPNLIVGSCPRSPDDVDRIADEAGATAILNLQSDHLLRRAAGVLMSLPIPSHLPLLVLPIQISTFHFKIWRSCYPEAVRVVNVLLHRGHTVYVHCTAGITRASSRAWRTSTSCRGCAATRPVTLVKNARPIAHPYLGLPGGRQAAAAGGAAGGDDGAGHSDLRAAQQRGANTGSATSD